MSDQSLTQQSTASRIQSSRLQKQIQFLHTISRTFEIINNNQVIFTHMLDDQQSLHIFIPPQYPFKEPLYALGGDKGNRMPVTEILEEWAPKIKIFQLIELLAIRINQQMKIKEAVKSHPILRPFHSNRAVSMIILLAITIRICIALGPYSGQDDYPHLGDFQAHRNWMSITINRPMSQWYYETQDQPWWRIDYPPVAAYLSYFLAKTYQHFEPQSMRIQFGYESDTLKTYMRLSSLMIDMIFLFPPIYLLSSLFQRKLPQILLFLLLIKPDAILIDHGHFQYNSLILGLILLSFYFLLTQNYYLTCLLYTIAVHSKQMAVYYSLAFLAALIGLTLQRYKYNRPKIIAEMAKYAIIVVVTSVVIWAPWFGSLENLQSVLTAIFPVHRGLYQLKVGNFWCITDIFIKWERFFSKQVLVGMCFMASVAFSLPSMLSMIFHPTRKSLTIGFATISLTFFMFSYHVHQKSILLPLLMMPLVSQLIGGWLCHQLIIAGCTGMFHLLVQDNQQFGYFGLMVIYVLFSISYTMLRQNTHDNPSNQLTLQWHRIIYQKKIFRLLFLVVVITLHILALVAETPSKQPYFWHLLLALFSFVFNIYFLLISNLLQLEWLRNIYSNQHHKNI